MLAAENAVARGALLGQLAIVPDSPALNECLVHLKLLHLIVCLIFVNQLLKSLHDLGLIDFLFQLLQALKLGGCAQAKFLDRVDDDFTIEVERVAIPLDECSPHPHWHYHVILAVDEAWLQLRKRPLLAKLLVLNGPGPLRSMVHILAVPTRTLLERDAKGILAREAHVGAPFEPERFREDVESLILLCLCKAVLEVQL